MLFKIKINQTENFYLIIAKNREKVIFLICINKWKIKVKIKQISNRLKIQDSYHLAKIKIQKLYNMINTIQMK